MLYKSEKAREYKYGIEARNKIYLLEEFLPKTKRNEIHFEMKSYFQSPTLFCFGKKLGLLLLFIYL